MDARGKAPDVQTGSAPCAPKSAPTKPRRGRPKGSVNRTNKIAKEAITEAAPHAFLIRIMEGRKFMRAAEDGAKRKVACYPTLQESTAAARTLLAKTCPDMKAVELAGKDGEPLVPNLAMTDKELARRVALILDQADKAAAEAAEDGSGDGSLPAHPRAEAPARARNGGPCPPPVDATAGAARKNGKTPPGGRFRQDDPSGGGEQAQSGFQNNFSKNAKPAPTEPDPGQEARCAGFVVRCTEGSRPDLPNSYQIRGSRGELLKKSVNGWSGALRWIKARVGADADMTIEVFDPSPDYFDSIRPDQQPFAVGGIEIIRGCPERKN